MSTVIHDRRRFLTISTAAVGTTGIALTSVPFIASWLPSERARAGGAPVTVDVSKLDAGQQITITWSRKPVWVLRRTPEMLAKLKLDSLTSHLRDPESQVTTQQPLYAQNTLRSIRPEYLVVIAICTHLGCVPTFRPELAPVDLGADWPGGYFCPCHGSRFDLAGRVFTGVPAPTNLVIPPYHFVNDTLIEIGKDSNTA